MTTLATLLHQHALFAEAAVSRLLPGGRGAVTTLLHTGRHWPSLQTRLQLLAQSLPPPKTHQLVQSDMPLPTYGCLASR